MLHNPNLDSDVMTEVETPLWLQKLKRAIRGNRRDAHNRYLQFATLGLDGKPRARMVVFRGFSPSKASFFIITDARSDKVKELDSSINLIIKTKCPEKWIIKDLETGQSYRANGQTELGKMFTPIND